IQDLSRCAPPFGTGPPSGLPMDDPVCHGDIQYKTITGGNPNLEPENSDSVYYEASVQPPFIKGLTVTMGYGYTHVKNVISTPDPQFIVDHPNFFPGAIVRGPPNQDFVGDPGEIQSISATVVNINEQNTHY